MAQPQNAPSPTQESYRVSRRVLLAGAAASAVLAACSSSDDGSSTSATNSTVGPAASDAVATAVPFETYVLAQRFPQDVQEPGLQRLPISLASTDGRLVSDGPDTFPSLGFDANLVRSNFENFGDSRRNDPLVR